MINSAILLSFKIIAVAAAITPSSTRPFIHNQTAVPNTPAYSTTFKNRMLISYLAPKRICL